MDKKKFFKKPKVLKVIKCNNKSDAIYSLKKSVDDFLNIKKCTLGEIIQNPIKNLVKYHFTYNKIYHRFDIYFNAR